MKNQPFWIAAGLAALGVLVATAGCNRAQAQTGVDGAGRPREIQLTIYKQDFAMVYESRPLDLTSGRNRLRLDNVSKTLDPESVLFDWKEAPKAPEVVSHTFDLGVPSGESLLNRLQGKHVQMLWNTQNGEPSEQIEGTLESTQSGGFVLRSGDKLYVNPNGTIVADGESGLVTMPQLTAEIDSPAKQEAKLGFAYQTRGMSWTSDYIGRLTADGEAMDLECWATLTNHTGIDYPNAKITLVAGSPNRAAVDRRRFQEQSAGGYGVALDYDAVKSEVPLRRSSLSQGEVVGELYAYKVPASASVGQEQMNRVKMLPSTRVPIKKDYSIRLMSMGGYYYDYGYGNGNPNRQNASLAISFVNDEKSNLGMPLPSGAVRIYDEVADTPTTIGAAGIGDTPKEQHVNLTLSKVFDVYCDSKMISSKRVDKRTIRKVFETVLHNEKKASVEIRLVQDFYGKKKVVSESEPGRQINSSQREWKIKVEPGGEKKLTWTMDFAG